MIPYSNEELSLRPDRVIRAMKMQAFIHNSINQEHVTELCDRFNAEIIDRISTSLQRRGYIPVTKKIIIQMAKDGNLFIEQTHDDPVKRMILRNNGREEIILLIDETPTFRNNIDQKEQCSLMVTFRISEPL